MLRVGLTGGIGAGKSAVAKYFRDLGICVVDADVAARQVVANGQPALQAIADHFGTDILLPDGELNRRKLRDLIFQDAVEKKWLEVLLHPLIRHKIWLELEAAQSVYAILESPLLWETDQHLLVTKTILVDIAEALQIERASQRDGANPEQIAAIIKNQMPRQERQTRADFVIDNSGSPEHTLCQVRQVHNILLDLAKNPLKID
jgi:dephospho-CoA kinase